jgi:hypothetical protein
MPVDARQFLLQLAPWMASNATPAVEFAATPRGLFLWEAVEDDAKPVYSVLSIYGGDVAWVGLTTLSIQCTTTGKAAAAWPQAQALFKTMFDAAGIPVRGLLLTGFKVLGFTSPRVPSHIGQDDKGRSEIVFNVDAQVVKTA